MNRRTHNLDHEEQAFRRKPLTFTTITPNEVEQWLEVAREARLADEDIFAEKARRGKTLQNGIAYALREDGRIIGTVMLEQTAYDQKHSATLLAFAIRPELRNKGYGKEIIKQSCDLLKQMSIKQVRLFTSMAGGYYEKQGFQKFGELTLNDRAYEFYALDLD